MPAQIVIQTANQKIMTFTINDCFLDSSILIEFNKGSKIHLFNKLQSDPNITCYVNEAVVSEFLFYYLANNGSIAPQTLKSRNEIKDVFANYQQYQLIKLCRFISNDDRLFTTVPQLMSQYNLLPNDAIILATCKIHNITKLAMSTMQILSFLASRKE